ncbi:MAG: hypothetical protein J0M35_19115 [Candidatus Obscuribacter phosphatis]|uniref:Uncharacterized protein n=1 Tax=Candidatus Obscuribacter phosphatis TaxID=1906157 RepID=A0A8J7TPX9_9BACT|nr:hypothetical protein [Candidatus Obscuribacter phosphatis]
MPDDADDARPKLQTETTGAGGGRKIRTAIGLGDGNDGGWYRPREVPGGPGRNEPVRHARFKDIAIDVLFSSTTRDYQDLYHRLSGKFPEFDLAEEGLVDALARMVLSAYTVAQYVPDAHVFDELRSTCPYFSDEQLLRIIELASRSKPMVR